jgi:hypothetical protein
VRWVVSDLFLNVPPAQQDVLHLIKRKIVFHLIAASKCIVSKEILIESSKRAATDIHSAKM